MVACARRRAAFLMEAMWSRFLPVMDVVAEWLKQGRIGEITLSAVERMLRVGTQIWVAGVSHAANDDPFAVARRH